MEQISNDKLIEELKDMAEWACANEYEVPICLQDYLLVAVERINKLQHECELRDSSDIQDSISIHTLKEISKNYKKAFYTADNFIDYIYNQFGYCMPQEFYDRYSQYCDKKGV